MSELKAGDLLLRGADREEVGAKALTYSNVRERLRPLGIYQQNRRNLPDQLF